MKMNYKLNENDRKLLALCWDIPLSITQIARKLDISVKNSSFKVKKLEAIGKVIVDRSGKGRSVKVRTIKGIEINNHMLEALRHLKFCNGEMSIKNFISIYPSSNAIENTEGCDKYQSIINVLYIYPPVVDQIIKLNDRGKKLVEEFIDKKITSKVSGIKGRKIKGI